MLVSVGVPCALPPFPGKCGEPTPPLVPSKRNALLVGDSITAQYAATVATLLGSEWNVRKNGGLKQGQDGDTTNGLLCTEPESSVTWLTSGHHHHEQRWDVIHAKFGMHDVKDRTSLETYERNVRALHERFQTRARRVVWATTTPGPDVAHDRNLDPGVKIGWIKREFFEKNMRSMIAQKDGRELAKQLRALWAGNHSHRNKRFLSQTRACNTTAPLPMPPICDALARADAAWDLFLSQQPNASLVPLYNAAMKRAVGSAAEMPCIDDLYGEVTRICGVAYTSCAVHRPGDFHFNANYTHELASTVAASIRKCASAEPTSRRTHCSLPPCVVSSECGDPTPPPVPGKRNALLVGDSISIQYAQPVRELLGDEWMVWKNGGFAHKQGQGGSTELGLFCTDPSTPDNWLASSRREPQWDVIHVNFGLHDVGDGTSLETYERNLRALHARFQTRARRVVWATTTPVPDLTQSIDDTRVDLTHARGVKLRWTKHWLATNMRSVVASNARAHRRTGLADELHALSAGPRDTWDERMLAKASYCKASDVSPPSAICSLFAEADARWNHLVAELPNATLVPLYNSVLTTALAEPPCIDDLYGEVTRVCGVSYANCTAHREPGNVHFSANYSWTLASAVAASIRACGAPEVSE